MADQTFVDPITGLPLGAHAFGVVSAGTASAEFTAEHRNRWGLSGAGHFQTAYILYTSTDGGLTWSTDSTEFTLRVTEALNPGADPYFTGQPTAEVPTARLDVAPLRSGCGYKLGIKFKPSLRTGAAQEDIRWKLGVLYNETFRAISLNPDAPTGILTGLGDSTVSEWVTAPTLANDTDKVTLGAGLAVVKGVLLNTPAGDVALDQNDGDSVALASGEEYIAVGAVYSDGTIITIKGSKAAVGAAVHPTAYTDFPCFVARVPYGGVIVTSTLLAVSGRCLVSDAGGLVVTVQPGRAVSPGYLTTPTTVQSLTLPDEATSTVYLSAAGVANVTAGIPLATVVTTGGDISSVTDARRILRPEPIRLKLPGNEAVATNVDRFYVPYAWTCDRVRVQARVAAAAATGETWLVVKHDLPSDVANAYIAAGGVSTEAAVQATMGAAGWITVDIAGITSGGTRAADIEVLLWIVQTA